MKKRSLPRILALHAGIFSAIALYLFITISFRIYCPFKYVTGLTCPACGATRAMFALFRGDFTSYLAYNPFALPLSAVLIISPHLRVLGKFRMPALIFCILTAAGSFIYNLLRIIYHA